MKYELCSCPRVPLASQLWARLNYWFPPWLDIDGQLTGQLRGHPWGRLQVLLENRFGGPT